MEGFRRLTIAVVFYVLLSHVLGTKILSHNGACNVTTDKGRIDLISLGNTDGTARFTNLRQAGSAYYIYEWNPCKDFTDTRGGPTENQCKNVAICQSSSYGITSFFNFGKTSTASWKVAPDGNVTLEYNDGSPNKVFKSSTVKMICDTSASTDMVTVLPQETDTLVQFELRSKHCCAVPVPEPASHYGGLSVGSILCISLLVILCLYVTAGIVFTMGYKKAQGRERIPNVEFWVGMPGLVKDGARFTFCCGWRQGSSGGGAKYDQL